MYVEEVCIDGFKSYAQRTVVPAFDPLFNAITGLNGSGKSNILDAICFVLGITNLSQVRLGLSDENAPKRTKTVLFPFPKIRVFSRLRDRSRRSFFCCDFFCSRRRRRPTRNIDSYASRTHLTPFPCIARQQQRRH
jgi:chromosome segregation ATPase